MPHLNFAIAAQRDLERTRRFLSQKNPLAAKRASHAIKVHMSALATTPEMGRPHPTLRGIRELLIPFGDGGYIARYRYDPDRDAVYVLRIWHQKETGH